MDGSPIILLFNFANNIFIQNHSQNVLIPGQWWALPAPWMSPRHYCQRSKPAYLRPNTRGHSSAAQSTPKIKSCKSPLNQILTLPARFPKRGDDPGDGIGAARQPRKPAQYPEKPGARDRKTKPRHVENKKSNHQARHKTVGGGMILFSVYLWVKYCPFSQNVNEKNTFDFNRISVKKVISN